MIKFFYKLKQNIIEKQIKNIPYNIKNIVGWIPILWNNFNWDGLFLCDILEYKLKLMKQYFERDAIIDDSQKVVNEISICLNALAQLKDDKYEEVLHDQYLKDFPFRMPKTEPVSGGQRIIFDYRDGELEANKEYWKACDIKKKELNKQLFDTIKKNIDGWWD
jgi:hypothetical protein